MECMPPAFTYSDYHNDTDGSRSMLSRNAEETNDTKIALIGTPAAVAYLEKHLANKDLHFTEMAPDASPTRTFEDWSNRRDCRSKRPSAESIYDGEQRPCIADQNTNRSAGLSSACEDSIKDALAAAKIPNSLTQSSTLAPSAWEQNRPLPNKHRLQKKRISAS